MKMQQGCQQEGLDVFPTPTLNNSYTDPPKYESNPWVFFEVISTVDIGLSIYDVIISF